MDPSFAAQIPGQSCWYDGGRAMGRGATGFDALGAAAMVSCCTLPPALMRFGHVRTTARSSIDAVGATSYRARRRPDTAP